MAEVKRDQRQRGRYLGGAVPWGYRVGEAGELVPIPEQQQAAIRRMRKLRDQGLALRDRGFVTLRAMLLAARGQLS